MFIEMTDYLLSKELIEKGDRVFRNNNTLEGAAANAQFLRFKIKDNSWTLELRCGFNKFYIPLQEHQVMILLKEDVSFQHIFKLKIIEHTIFDYNKMN